MTRRPTLDATARATYLGPVWPPLALSLALAGTLVPAAANEAAEAATQPAPAAAAAPDPQSPARVNTRAEPQVLQRVLEDEHIVIEELRVRGQPVRISVRGKTPGARGYEINVGPGGRDASQESGRAGQSAWRLFSF